jgi:adenylate cyclase
VNVAARLESLAQPGTICVGEATWERTRDRFTYRLLGERAVKGRSAPVGVYELVDA